MSARKSDTDVFDLEAPATPQAIWTGVILLSRQVSDLSTKIDAVLSLSDRVEALERVALTPAQHVRIQHSMRSAEKHEEWLDHGIKSVIGYVAIALVVLAVATLGLSQYLAPVLHATGH